MTESSLRNWVEQAPRGSGRRGKTGLTTAEREELARLRKEVRELRMERDVLKKSRGLLREGPPVKFAWIQTEKASYPLTKLCSLARRHAEWLLRGGSARNRVSCGRTAA